MNSENNNFSQENTDEPRTLTLLQQIKSGTISPKSISAEQRRMLVCFLMVEGQSTAEMAHLLEISERTIERDKKTIRQENSITKDPELAGQMVGRLMSEAETAIQKIRKYERDNQASPATKIEAEHHCFQIFNSLTERLQSLGYLPTAAQRLEAELKHDAGPLISLEQIGHEVKRLQQINEGLPQKQDSEPGKEAEFSEIITEFENDSGKTNDQGANNE